jgi:hypothetical protein
VTLGYVPPRPKEKRESSFGKFEEEWRQFYATDDDLYRAYLDHLEKRGKKSLRKIGPDSTEVEIQRAIALGIRVEQLADRIRTEPGDWMLASEPLPDTFTATDLEGQYQVERIDPCPSARAKRERKGKGGISPYGTKSVRSGTHCLQNAYGRQRLGFLTLTLPNSDRYLPIWCEQWAEIVRKFNQELQRELERQGAPNHVIGVTEIQTKRSEDTGYPVPHLHACFVAWDGKTYMKGAKTKTGKRMPAYYISHGRMQGIFARILANEVERITGEVVNPDELNPRVEVKPVKKSAEGYLGKYMSKGGKDVKQFLDQQPDRTDLPTHWWHCTKGLRTILKGLITELPPEWIEAALTQMEDLKALGIVRYARDITKEIGGVERLLGKVFRFAPEYNPTDPRQIAIAFGTA